MQEWGWAIASAILLITLVQVLVYYYLMRGEGSPLASNGQGNRRSTAGVGRRDAFGGDETDERAGGRRYGEEDVRRCSNCGAPNDNDPVYTYCRSCGRQM